MDMKGLKENGQDEKKKLKHWKLAQNSPKLAQTRQGKITLKELAQASNNSLR